MESATSFLWLLQALSLISACLQFTLIRVNFDAIIFANHVLNMFSLPSVSKSNFHGIKYQTSIKQGSDQQKEYVL